MEPFDSYPQQGQSNIGRPKDWTNCRHGYGKEVMEKTGQNSCAYCGISFVDDFSHWLLVAVDHVVPHREAKRLGISPELTHGFINLVLACSGCNGMDNRHKVGDVERKENWTLTEFVALRDRVFQERKSQIEAKRNIELQFFRDKWQVKAQ